MRSSTCALVSASISSNKRHITLSNFHRLNVIYKSDINHPPRQSRIGVNQHTTLQATECTVQQLISLPVQQKYMPFRTTTLGWRSGVVVSALASINEVNLRRARLVLRWATVSGFNFWCWTFISVQPATQGQLSLPSLRVGK